jgi:hypothetical protein
VISRLGPAAAVSILGAMLKGVDITTSNVPGPPFPVFMAGARVEEFYAFGPLAGAAINITLFSYDGACTSASTATGRRSPTMRCSPAVSARPPSTTPSH